MIQGVIVLLSFLYDRDATSHWFWAKSGTYSLTTNQSLVRPSFWLDSVQVLRPSGSGALSSSCLGFILQAASLPMVTPELLGPHYPTSSLEERKSVSSGSYTSLRTESQWVKESLNWAVVCWRVRSLVCQPVQCRWVAAPHMGLEQWGDVPRKMNSHVTSRRRIAGKEKYWMAAIRSSLDCFSFACSFLPWLLFSTRRNLRLAKH